jgi:uncharacterized protein involved in exopolysaccharide biosynthesis/Mrp family chromosome partitioning ATPase
MPHSDALQMVSRGMPGGGFGPEDPESINFEAILRFLRKRYRLCLAWLFGGLLLGIGYAAVSGPSYTAADSVLLEDRTPRTAGDVAVAQSDVAHSSYIETQLQVFASDEIIGRVVDTLKLVDDPEFGQKAGGLRTWLRAQARSLLRSNTANEPDGRVVDTLKPVDDPEFGQTEGGLRTWLVAQARSLLRLNTVRDDEPRHATVVRVRRALSVHRIGTSDVLEIQFTADSPERAATFAGAIIDANIDSRVAEQENAQKIRAEHDWKLVAELRDKAFPAVPPGEATASMVAPGPEARARFLEEQQKTESYRALYGRLLQRALGNLDAQLPSSGLEVITPATPPLIASWHLTSIIALAAIGGVVGLGHALSREMTDDVLRSVDDLGKFAKTARVVVIPNLDKTELRYKPSPRDNTQPSYRVDCRRAYEATGKLAVAMLESSSRRSGIHVIGVVSPQVGAGASLVAAQLAKVVAETGSKTCLLDANWRLPLSDAPLPDETRYGGLTGWTERTASTAGTLDILMLRATWPVSDLTAALSIVTALESASVEHQWIVVDFHSPAQTVDLEATINLMDQVVVIVEAQRTTHQGLRDVLNIVPPSKLASIVLNKVKLKSNKPPKYRTPHRNLTTVTADARAVTDLLG